MSTKPTLCTAQYVLHLDLAIGRFSAGSHKHVRHFHLIVVHLESGSQTCKLATTGNNCIQSDAKVPSCNGTYTCMGVLAPNSAPAIK